MLSDNQAEECCTYPDRVIANGLFIVTPGNMWRVHWAASDWKIHVLIASCIIFFIQFYAPAGGNVAKGIISQCHRNFANCSGWSKNGASLPKKLTLIVSVLAVYDINYDKKKRRSFLCDFLHTHTKHTVPNLLMMLKSFISQQTGTHLVRPAWPGYWCFSLMSHPLGCRAAANKLLCHPWSCALMSSLSAP